MKTKIKKKFAKSSLASKERKNRYRKAIRDLWRNTASNIAVKNDNPHYPNELTSILVSRKDLFCDDIYVSEIDRCIREISCITNHQVRISTKHPERMLQYFSNSKVPDNLQLGVVVETSSDKLRIDILRLIKAPVHFILCKPLIEDIGILDFAGIDYIIAGGENGPNSHPMKPEWISSIKRQADQAGVTFIFAGWGAWGPSGIKQTKNWDDLLINEIKKSRINHK